MNFFRSINNTVADIASKPGVAIILALLSRVLLAAIFIIAAAISDGMSAGQTCSVTPSVYFASKS